MRRLAHAAAKRVGALRLRRLIAGTPPPYRLELGTNEVNHDGWIPTDVRWRARNYLDATGPWPFPPDSISHVYADNVIEHVSLDGARSLLREAARTMQPGGRIRLVTPDAGGAPRSTWRAASWPRPRRTPTGARGRAWSTTWTSCAGSSSSTSTATATRGTRRR